MAVKKPPNNNTKKTIIILSTLAALVGIGIATGFINFTPMQSGKPSLAKDTKCFEDLKRKNSPQELMEIMKKKKMTESYCDLL